MKTTPLGFLKPEYDDKADLVHHIGNNVDVSEKEIAELNSIITESEV